MIISGSYFKGNIHIPNSNDTAPNSNLLGNVSNLEIFIDEYEPDVLSKCLTHSLYNQFSEELDPSSPNGLKSTAHSKWDSLLNGLKYEIDGKQVEWRGLVFKQGNLNRSLIAYYVYYHFLNDDITKYRGTGVQSEKTKNSDKVSPIPKAVRAWRKFFELTVGNYNSPVIIEKDNALGIDWVNGNNGLRSLYQFIQDMNNLNPDTYPNWQPYLFHNLNNLGV